MKIARWVDKHRICTDRVNINTGSTLPPAQICNREVTEFREGRPRRGVEQVVVELRTTWQLRLVLITTHDEDDAIAAGRQNVADKPVILTRIVLDLAGFTQVNFRGIGFEGIMQDLIVVGLLKNPEPQHGIAIDPVVADHIFACIIMQSDAYPVIRDVIVFNQTILTTMDVEARRVLVARASKCAATDGAGSTINTCRKKPSANI